MGSVRNLKLLLLLLPLIALAGCSQQPPPTPEAVVGRYRGVYKGGAVETFELRADKRFTQQLVIGDQTAYQHEGTWRLDGAYVVFDDMRMAIRMGSDEVVVPKVATDNVSGLWITLNGSSIVFDIDYRYSIEKIDATSPPKVDWPK